MSNNLKIDIGGLDIGYGTNTNQNGMSVDIFFAGCSIQPKCPGCHNPDLWNVENGWEMTLASVKNYIQYAFIDGAVHNLVFMGGEPLDQPKAVFLLAHWAKDKLGLKTWLYTGYDYKHVPTNIKDTLDVIVSGRYDETKRAEPGAFPASTNQEVHYGK